MPDRPRNRPRIAGQRRTPDAPGAPRTTDEVTTDDRAGTVEAPAEDVTPDTSEVATALEEAAVEASKDTQGEDEATAEPVPAAAPEASGGRLGVWLTAILGVLVVLVLTFAVVLGIRAWQGKQAEDARGQAAAAGRKAAETALSYDYRDLDKSFAAARATMTPEFAAKFDETAKVAGELATKSKATVRADVREVGVRDGDADRVTLIIFVNQTTTSTITEGKPRVDLNRTRFTMVRNGDQWLVQEIAGL